MGGTGRLGRSIIASVLLVARRAGVIPERVAVANLAVGPVGDDFAPFPLSRVAGRVVGVALGGVQRTGARGAFPLRRPAVPARDHVNAFRHSN